MRKAIFGGLTSGAAGLFLIMAYTNTGFNWYDNFSAEVIAWLVFLAGLIFILVGLSQRK